MKLRRAQRAQHTSHWLGYGYIVQNGSPSFRAHIETCADTYQTCYIHKCWMDARMHSAGTIEKRGRTNSRAHSLGASRLQQNRRPFRWRINNQQPAQTTFIHTNNHGYASYHNTTVTNHETSRRVIDLDQRSHHHHHQITSPWRTTRRLSRRSRTGPAPGPAPACRKCQRMTS
jgi:hypothetical protein